MAKFMPGPVVAEIRGSVGGTVFSRNRYGAICRYRAKPTVSVTAPALAAKARMTAATQLWQTMSDAERLAWNQWADGNPIVGALGEAQILTGHVASVGINCRLQLMGIAMVTAPPITPAPAPLTTMTVAPDATLSGCDITFTATPTGATDVLWILATQVASAGKIWVENLLKANILSGAAQASPFDAITVVEARIGALVIGQFLDVKVFVASNVTGLLSAPLRARAVVV